MAFRNLHMGGGKKKQSEYRESLPKWLLPKKISTPTRHTTPRINTLSRLTATTPTEEGAFSVGCPPRKQPTKKASSPSGGGSWHVVPDGRGICKALGTVDFCPGHYPTRAGTPPPLHAPSVALRRQPTARNLSRRTAHYRGLYLLRPDTAGR